MKKISLIVSILSLLFFGNYIASCSSFFGGDEEPPIDYIPVQLNEGGSWVFVDHTGTQIGTQEWEFEPTVSVDGVFIAQLDSGMTVYRWEGNVAKPIEGLTSLVEVGEYHEGVIPVCRRLERIRVADKMGNTKFTLDPIDGNEIMSCALAMKDGMLVITDSKGKTGAVDKDGNLVIKPTYDMMSDFNGGVALAMNYPENYVGDPTYFVVDKEGNATKIKARIGSDEIMCALEGFSHGYAYLSAPYDTITGTATHIRISPDGTAVATDTLVNSWDYLENNSHIATISKGDSISNVWVDADGKKLRNFNQNWPSAELRFVTEYDYNYTTNETKITVYNLEANPIAKFNGSRSFFCPGGQFGLIVAKIPEDDYKPTEVTMIDNEGKEVENFRFASFGRKLTIYPEADLDEGECGRTQVFSAYIDVTAAASTLSKMLGSGSVKGKQTFYIGQSVAEVLDGENARFFNGGDRTFTIPTDTVTYTLGEGPGFWINGEAKSSTSITSAVYKKYFDHVYTDYWGTRWGYWRNKQTGVKFNPAAKIESFDLRLTTFFPASQELREGLKRHLKKSGFTLVESSENYDEYHNNFNAVLIYGSPDSKGIGAIISEIKTLSKMSDKEKSALAAKL